MGAMDLLKKIGQKDKKAIEWIYDQVYPMLRQDTEEAFQEALVVLFKQSRDPKFQLPCEPSEYVYALALQILRSKSCFKLDSHTVELIKSSEDNRMVQKIFKCARTKLTGNSLGHSSP